MKQKLKAGKASPPQPTTKKKEKEKDQERRRKEKKTSIHHLQICKEMNAYRCTGIYIQYAYNTIKFFS